MIYIYISYIYIICICIYIYDIYIYYSYRSFNVPKICLGTYFYRQPSFPEVSSQMLVAHFRSRICRRVASHGRAEKFQPVPGTLAEALEAPSSGDGNGPRDTRHDHLKRKGWIHDDTLWYIMIHYALLWYVMIWRFPQMGVSKMVGL